MERLFDLIGDLARPMVLGLLLVVALGFLAAERRDGAGGLECRGFTDNAAINRTLCRLDPSRLWNMPVADLLPSLGLR